MLAVGPDVRNALRLLLITFAGLLRLHEVMLFLFWLLLSC
jgi:hypothetical protein